MRMRGIAVWAVLAGAALAYGQVKEGVRPPAPDPPPAMQSDAQVRDGLQEPIKELTSEAQSLEKVMRFLSDNTNTSITMDWPALEAAGIPRDAAITLALKDMPLQKCIEAILANADGGKGLLIYEVKDGGVFVTTKVSATAPATAPATTHAAMMPATAPAPQK